MIKNPGEWGKAVKDLRNLKFSIGNNIEITHLKDYFEHLLNPSSQQTSSTHYAEPLVKNKSMDQNFQLEELNEVQSSLKNGKAPGDDRISYEFFKNAPETFLISLLSCFNAIYETGRKLIIKSIIFPLYKKGDPNIASNYRGISFKNSSAKIFILLLLRRFENYLEENSIMKENQAGFRRGYTLQSIAFIH